MTGGQAPHDQRLNAAWTGPSQNAENLVLSYHRSIWNMAKRRRSSLALSGEHARQALAILVQEGMLRASEGEEGSTAPRKSGTSVAGESRCTLETGKMAPESGPRDLFDAPKSEDREAKDGEEEAEDFSCNAEDLPATGPVHGGTPTAAAQGRSSRRSRQSGRRLGSGLRSRRRSEWPSRRPLAGTLAD